MYDGKQVVRVETQYKKDDLYNIGVEMTNRKGTGNYSVERKEFNYEYVSLTEKNLYQEVKKNLNGKWRGEWESRWEQPISWSNKSAEGYAFLWKKNSRKIKLNDTRDNNGSVRKNPKILNGYSYNHSRSMIRPPYYASFFTLDSFAEIRIINTHIIYGDTKTLSIEMRREEFKLMAENIYTRLSQEIEGHNRPIYTFIVGDYNLNLISSGAKGPYVDEEYEISYKGKSEILVTKQNQLTTLKRPKEGEYVEGVEGYSQNYDHCSYGRNRFQGIGVDVKRIDVIEKYYGGDFAKYKKEVSDHVPIVVEFEMK